MASPFAEAMNQIDDEIMEIMKPMWGLNREAQALIRVTVLKAFKAGGDTVIAELKKLDREPI